MKILYFFYFLLSFPTTLSSQNEQLLFKPYWEFGLQYNSEITSVFKQTNNSALFTEFNVPGQIEASGGTTLSFNVTHNHHEKFGTFYFLNIGARNFYRKFPSSATSNTGIIIERSEKLRHTYNIVELAAGIYFRPKVKGRFLLKFGLGFSRTLSFKLETNLPGSFRLRPGLFLHKDDRFLNGTPVFSLLAVQFLILKTNNASVFIEPHAKTDLWERKADFFEQQFYTFGIGIGGSIKISN